MPITAKLSKAFYDRLGEAVANELVDWLNTVDATYRADLRELNELNFSRFDSKLEQRAAELRGEVDRRIAELRGEFAELRRDMERGFAEVRAEMHGLKAELIKWMFVFWAGTMITVLLAR